MMNRTPHSEKRAFQRIPAVIDFHCFNIDCFGTITNLSANGMFIRSKKMSFPFESQFEICIPFNEGELKVRVKVKRITKSTDYYDGIAVELVNPSKNYLEFITKLRSGDKPRNSIHN
jgi:hypothetical protein